MPASLDAPVATAVAAYRDGLVASLGSRLLGVTVFGSAARGEAREDSDVDVLVRIASPSFEERRLAAHLAWEVGFAHHLVLSPLVVSEAEWKELDRRERLIVAEITRDGIDS